MTSCPVGDVTSGRAWRAGNPRRQDAVPASRSYGGKTAAGGAEEKHEGKALLPDAGLARSPDLFPLRGCRSSSSSVHDEQATLLHFLSSREHALPFIAPLLGAREARIQEGA